MRSITGHFYKIGTKIGSGSFGTVYNTIRDDGKHFALKKFTKDPNGCDLGTLREISILKILQNNENNYILNMEDLIIEEENFCIVMKKYNTDLSKVIKKDCLSSAQKKNIILKITKALAFLHKNGIIHRDIKPENILLDNNYNPILCDYSLSKIFTGVSCEGTHTGNVATVTYRAPEVISKKPYSFPIDSWSMGIIFYELFSKNKFTATKDTEALSFLKDKMDKLKENKIGTVIKGLLHHNPDKRWTPKDVLKFLFNDNYDPPCIWKGMNSCLLSTTIKKICQDFEIEKKITLCAAQQYLNTTNCDGYYAIMVACKFYETELRDFSDFVEFPDMEKDIFIRMGFNLFV
jgi:serine/threonine protein kinase